MRRLAYILIAAALLAGCETDLPNVVELQGQEAKDAVAGLNRPGSDYVDIKPDGSLTLSDTAVSHDQFRAGVAKLVAQGDRTLTVRVDETAPKDAFEFVRKVAEDSGIQTVEIVRFSTNHS